MKTHSKSGVETHAKLSSGGVTSQKSKGKSSNRITPTTEFGKSLKALLGTTAIAKQVNEEELFAASAHQLIKNRYGAQTAEDFKSAFRLNMVDKPKKEKHPSAERAANEALDFFVKSSLMTTEEVKDIRDLASQVAQLDENTDKLWDSWGKTRAVTNFKKGEALVQARLETSGNAPIASARAGSADAQAKMATYGGEQSGKASAARSGSWGKTPTITQDA
jgi:hypothetical protein